MSPVITQATLLQLTPEIYKQVKQALTVSRGLVGSNAH